MSEGGERQSTKVPGMKSQILLSHINA